MRTITALLVSLVISALVPASAFALVGTGKRAAFSSETGVTIFAADTTLATAVIDKGKRRHVLAVEAMVTNLGGFATPRRYTCGVLVNTLPFEPVFMTLYNPANTGTATLSGTFWIDLDTYPELVGVGLYTSLHCTELTGTGDTGVLATLTARLQKK